MGIQVLNGGKLFPKKGRLGSGAYWPRGVPITGNPFGPNNTLHLRALPPAPVPFGSPSNAGNNTQFGQNRAQTGVGASHPNVAFRAISMQNRTPAMKRNGRGQQTFPIGGQVPLIQPHERNTMQHKVSRRYKTQFGASEAMPSDTAFQRRPPAKRPAAAPAPSVEVLAVPRAAQVSFVSKNNLWIDPNNSFLQGVPSPAGGGVGMGRWQRIKRGAAG